MCFSLQRRAIFHVFSQQPPPHPPLYRGYFSTQTTHKSLKNTAFRDFPNISRLWIFFLLTFAQLYLLSSDSTSLLCCVIFSLCCSALLFQLSILSEVRLLNFLRVPCFHAIDVSCALKNQCRQQKFLCANPNPHPVLSVQTLNPTLFPFPCPTPKP